MEWEKIEKKLDRIVSCETCADEEENQFLDFKRCPTKKNEVINLCREMGVCFGNSRGGSLVLGVEDNVMGDAAITGCPEFSEKEIEKGVRDGTVQSVFVDVIYHEYHGKKLIEMKVPSGPEEGVYCLTNGLQTIRAGAECVPFTGRVVSPKLRSPGKIDFSRRIVDDIEFEDLSTEGINRIREVIKSKELSDFLELNDLNLLKALRLVKETDKDGLQLTTAALLFCGEIQDIEHYIPQSELVFCTCLAP